MVSFSAGQEAARRLLEGPQRYTCLAGGTRSGKTFLIVRMILIRALQAKGSPCSAPPRQCGAGFHRARHASSSRAALFSRMRQEHRQDGYFALPNDSRVWIGA
jgi:hypothetical protein